MEATPDATAPEGVQVRTADGRVARVLLKNPGGWYDIKIDDEKGRVQRSFFAPDQGELLQTVPRKEHAKKENKRKPAQDTPLRLRDKDGTIVLRTTMEVWSTSSDLDVPRATSLIMK